MSRLYADTAQARATDESLEPHQGAHDLWEPMTEEQLHQQALAREADRKASNQRVREALKKVEAFFYGVKG